MKVITLIQDTFQYLVKGVSRLFQPTDDDYPKTGVQPYSGDPSEDQEKYS